MSVIVYALAKLSMLPNVRFFVWPVLSFERPSGFVRLALLMLCSHMAVTHAEPVISNVAIASDEERGDISPTISSTISPFFDPGPVVEHIQSLDGLSLNGAIRMVQGKFGFLWLATNDGLWRFDGHSIKTYHHDEDNPNSLPDNNISDLLVDDDGTIWVSTRIGLSRFSPQTEHFESVGDFDHEKEDAITNVPQAIRMTLGNNNKLWSGSTNGITVFDRTSLQSQQLDSTLQPMDTAYPEHIPVLYQDKQQRLWFYVVGKGLFVHDPKTQRIRHFYHDANDKNSLDSNAITAILQTDSGTIWVGTKYGLNRFVPGKNEFKRYPIPLNKSNRAGNIERIWVTSLFEDKTHQLWIGTLSNGVSLLKPDAERVTEINQGSNDKFTLSALSISDISQDRSGVIWFLTLNSGLIKLNPDALIFEHQVSLVNVDLRMYMLFTDSSGILWMGSNLHLYAYDEAIRRFIPVIKDIGKIHYIAEHTDHTLLLAVKGRGILRLDTTTKKMTTYAPPLPAGVLHGMAVDQQGILWLGFSGKTGLYSFDPHSQLYQQQFASPVESILMTSRQLFVGTRFDGLKILDLLTGVWSVIDDEMLGPVWSIYQDRPDRVWLGTTKAGLVQLDLATLQLSIFSYEGGHHANHVMSVIGDHQGYLWLGTHEGIARFNPHTGKGTPFDHRDGLRLASILRHGTAITNSGDIVMSATDELVVFSPQRLSELTTVNPPGQMVLLTDFKLAKGSVSLQSQDSNSPLITTIDATEAITLPYDANLFSITFASRFYKSQTEVRYASKMEGLSDHWQETPSHSRTATFTGLRPGEYTFKVKASNPDGSWNDNTRSLRITITSPWWATTWAYFVYVLLVSIAVLGFNLARTKALVERSRLLKAQVAERTMELKQRAATIERLLEDKEKLFANISHEFRTPLTLILGPLDAELKKATDESSRNLLSLAKANGQRLLAMVDQLLDLARVNDHQVQTKVAKDVVNACDFLVASYDSLAQERGLSLRFDNQLVQPVSVDMLEDALEKILSNLLTNALKYSKADGVITLKLAIATAGFVQISVTDTGQGISPDDQQHIFKRFTRVDNANGYMPGVGIGLALIKELISQHQGTIAVQSELGTGSVFTVTLPLSDNQNNSTSEVNEALVLSAVGKTKLDQRPLAKLSEVQPMIIGDKPDDNLPGILVIEDNAEMRQYIVACLSGRFHCTSAVDGEQGVAMAREMLPDLVISDVMMPKMNGFEVTKCLKGDDLTSHIPLILLTAQGDRESRLKGWAENADEFLQKPFNTDELLIRIDNLLSIRSLLRQRYQRAFTEPKAQNASSSSLSSPLPSLLPSNITAEIGVARVTESANHGSLAEEEADQETAVNIVHQAFIDRVNEVLELNYTDEAFDVGQFAAQMALSGRQFSRKMKTLLDLSPVESIRSFRLKKAAEQLASGVTPSTVSHQVGFASHSYFSQCFKAQYNCLPSHYADAE